MMGKRRKIVKRFCRVFRGEMYGGDEGFQEGERFLAVIYVHLKLEGLNKERS